MIQFVQWLSEKLKITPGEVVQMLNEAPEEEVKKYTDLFLTETTKETGKFKSGGKINAAVTKFQNGGEVDYHKWLQDIGYSTGGGPLTDEELRLLDNGMRKRYMQETGKNIPLNTKPRSNRLQIAGGDLPLRNGTTEQRSFDRIRVYNGEGKPDTQIDKIYYTNRPNAGSTERRITGSDTTFVNNYVNPNTRKSVFTKEDPYDEQGNNMWERYQEIWDEYGIKQEGGHITRREAFNAFMSNNEGATRADARKALRSAKMTHTNSNLAGNRNDWAKNVIAGKLQESKEDIMPTATPTSSFASLIKPEIPLTEQFTIPNMSPRVIERPVEDDNIDLSGISFRDMFAAARKSGVKEFDWNGKRYNTNLATGVGAVQNPAIVATTENTTTPNSEESKTYPALKPLYDPTEVNKVFARKWIQTGEGWPDNYPRSFILDLTGVSPENALQILSNAYHVRTHGDAIKRQMAIDKMKKFNTPRPSTPAPWRRIYR